MNPRECFTTMMGYAPAERLPVLALEPFEESAIERWRHEGLPADADPVEFLGMSHLAFLPFDFGPRPSFSQEALADDGEFVVKRSFMGALVRCRKDNPTMFYGHVDHPVKTRRDWETYKQLFQASSPGRLSADWADTVVPRLNASSDPVGVCLWPFFFRLGFYSMGMERFLSAFHEEPDLIHDMFDHWGRFTLDLLGQALGSVRLDFALFAEDLAGKNGPLISPDMYRDFWRPHQQPIVRLLQAHRVPLICQWTAGQFDVLIPELMEQGFNCTWPLEVMAGMDAPALRRRFGRSLRLAGNIAKEAVIAGPAAIDREIARLTPLARAGGFIPALDDMGAPDMPFAHYTYLIRALQAIRR